MRLEVDDDRGAAALAQMSGQELVGRMEEGWVMLWTAGIGWWRLDDDEIRGEHVDGKEPEEEEDARRR